MDPSPSTLYKYFGPERVDVLTNQLIRYSPLGAFNDPFEGQPEITSMGSSDELREHLVTALAQETRDSYNKLPEDARTNVTFEMWAQHFAQQFLLNESDLIQEMHQRTPMMQNLLIEKLNALVGALCLSEVPDSLLMWAHYGTSHTGFALEFDAKHSYFHEEKGPDDEFRHIRRVLYRESRPSAAFTEFDSTDVFLVKSIQWSYEREWRIFRGLAEAESTLPGEPFDVHLFRFPPGAIKAVILGSRITKKTSNAIVNAIRSKPELAHIKLKKAQADKSHFLLRITNEAL